MHFERLTSPSHPLYETATALYAMSFPLHEQRLAPSQRAILRCEDYHFTLIMEKERFLGTILYWETTEHIYVEHFCILPDMQGQGFGQQALHLLRQEGKPIILEIDPPVDALSLRRRGFYLRCGFSENPYPHVHPPYRPGNEGHTLVIMSCPDPISPAAFAAFRHHLEQQVMRDVY